MWSDLDRYLLELILLDTISVSGGRCIPQAERVIQHYLPPGLYDRIIARYDELSADFDERDARFLRQWFRRAARQAPSWKRRMIVRFLHILSAGGPIGLAELADVAALAAQMGARRECRQVFDRFFGWAHRPEPALARAPAQARRETAPRRTGKRGQARFPQASLPYPI